MRKTWKKFFTIGLAISMVAGLMGCQGEKKESDTAELRFAWWGGDSRHEATQKIVEAFEEQNPNVTVNMEFGSISGYVEKNSLAILNGTSADVIQIGSEYVSDYSGGGENFYDLYQLRDVLDLSQFPEDALKQNEVNGKLMAVPISLTGRVFIFNKTTFDKIGVEIPKDLESLYAAGRAFEAYGEGYYPLVLGEYDRQLFMMYYLQSKYNRPWISNNQLNYSEGEIAEAFGIIKKLEEAHAIPTLATLAGDMADTLDKNPHWIEGSYAGAYTWDSAVPAHSQVIQEQSGQELVIGDYIKCGDYDGVFSKISMSFAITASTEHPREAAKLINFILNDPSAIEMGGTERGIPCSAIGKKVLDEKGLGDPLVKAANKKMSEAAAFAMDPSVEDSDLNANPDGIYFKVQGKLSSDLITPEEAAKELTEGILNCLAE